MLSRTMRRAFRCPCVPGGVRRSRWLWRRCWRRHRKLGCVVRDNSDTDVGWYHDRHMARIRKAANKISPPAKQGAS
jgi:hypothetical protein